MAGTRVVYDLIARDRASRTVDKVGGKFSAFGAIATQAFKGAALAGGALIATGALIGVKTAANLEQAGIAFETLLGSGRKADKFLRNLSKFAAKTPFELPGLIDASRQLIGVGQSASSVIPTLTAWGDAAGALGLGQEQFNRIMLAVTQSMSKGKVQAEELMQITEAGVPIWPLLSRALDKPIPKLQKLSSEGKLLAKDVFPALEKQMAKEYGGAMTKQSQTLTGIWSTLMDTINIGLANTLKPLLPFMKDALSGGIRVLGGVFNKLPGIIETVGPKVAGFIGFVKDTAAPAVIDFGRALINRFVPVESISRKFGELTTIVSDFFAGLTGSAAPPAGALMEHVFDPSEATKLGTRLRNILSGGIGDALENIDTKKLGASLGTALSQAIGWVGRNLSKLMQKLADAFAKVEWVELGKTVGRTAIPFAIGFVTSVLDPLMDGKFWKDHWKDILIAAASIIPVGRVAGIIGKVFGKVPILGTVLRFTEKLGKGLEKGLGVVLRGVGKFLSAIGKGFVTGFRKVFPGVGKEFGKKLGAFPTWVGVTAIKVADKARAMVRGLGDAILGLGGWIGKQIGKFVGWLVKPFAKAGSWLVDKGKKFVDGMLRGVSSIARTVGRWIKANVIDKATQPFARAGSWLIDNGKRLVGGLKNGVVSIARTVGRWMKRNVIDKVTSPFKRAGSWLVRSGTNLVSGLKDGMFNALRNARRWFSSVGDRIVRGVKDFFGIKSPSRVFMGLGGHLVGGLIKGMLNKNPVTMAKRVFGSMTGALRNLFDKGMVGLSGLSSKALTALFGGAPGSIAGGSAGANQRIAQAMLAQFGWGRGQWAALRQLWHNESGWNHRALNPSSGAYGIPQSLPASKMASAGPDWRTNAATQIRWGMGYIRSRYGSPSNALAAWMSRSPHWYDSGGFLPPGTSVVHNGTGRKEPTAVFTPDQWKTLHKIAGGGGGGGPEVLEVHIEIGGEVVRVVRSEIRETHRGLKRVVLAGGG